MAKQRIDFPVSVGDTVKCMCKETDCYGNPVVTLHPYEVKGLAIFDGKMYVLDNIGEAYEIGTEYCIIPESEEKPFARINI
jgi:hypothetical protein